MKLILPLLLLATAATFAADYPRVIFSDDFTADGFGKTWGHYKSASVVKDGVLRGITAPESDHSAVDVIRIAPELDLNPTFKVPAVLFPVPSRSYTTNAETKS